MEILSLSSWRSQVKRGWLKREGHVNFNRWSSHKVTQRSQSSSHTTIQVPMLVGSQALGSVAPWFLLYKGHEPANVCPGCSFCYTDWVLQMDTWLGTHTCRREEMPNRRRVRSGCEESLPNAGNSVRNFGTKVPTLGLIKISSYNKMTGPLLPCLTQSIVWAVSKGYEHWRGTLGRRQQL